MLKIGPVAVSAKLLVQRCRPMQRCGTVDYRGLLASYWTEFGAALETQEYGARERLDGGGRGGAGPSDGGKDALCTKSRPRRAGLTAA